MMNMRGLIVLAVVVGCVQIASAKENTVRFVIVPGGGGGEATIPLDTPPIADSTCVFKYDVYGATTESWFGKIAANPETQEIECTIYRGGEQETYLLFNWYEISVGTEDTSEVVSAQLTDGEGEELEESSFKMEKHVLRQADGWKGSVMKFVARAKYYI